ncbi:MAG: hypothetical protein LAO04_22415 [Acidobacteriia bacterium]|nr:hypothetical protein [Terriglobia bacterium]
MIAIDDGDKAWQALRTEDPPLILILDWMMPKADGLEVCWRVWGLLQNRPTYIILLRASDGLEDLIRGLGPGADTNRLWGVIRLNGPCDTVRSAAQMHRR